VDPQQLGYQLTNKAMIEPNQGFSSEQEPTPEISTEPGSKFASIARRVILACLALIVIFSMLSSLVALPETVETPSSSDLGLTEKQIIQRYGQPDGRSDIQTIVGDGAIGLAPRRLDQGERFYSLRYDEGPLTLIFHLVPPETYLKHNAYRDEAQEWVVIERFIGASSVIY
jgi:hypothetical protein